MRKRVLLAMGVAAVAAVTAVVAVAATGESGITGGDRITTFAGITKFGTGGFSGDGGPATKAKLSQPYGVAVDTQGNVYIGDSSNHRVRKVTLGGKITTIAGGGTDYIESGPATSAYLSHPNDVAVDGQGNVYITDGSFVYRLSSGGILTRIAGSVNGGFSGDGGAAAKAELNQPDGIAVDQRGNVYIADTRNHRVRKISGGTITTVAGTGVAGFSGDGGRATSARLNIPQGVEVDRRGNVYVTDRFNMRVRKVSTSGTISTVAGNGRNAVVVVNGRATSTPLSNPWGVAVDAQGNVYLSTDANVYKVSPAGTITTVAGLGPTELSKGSGDGGPATSGTLAHATAMAFDRQGNLYIADVANAAIRKISKGSAGSALKLTLGGASTQRLLGQKGISVTARCGAPCSLSATGSVAIIGTRYVFGLTRASAGPAAGSRTLTLRFPAAAQRQFRQLLKPGLRARAVITVKATDKAGRTTTSKRTVAVR